ncbi:class I SAM-dependent rRNA methyltransferase [Geoalkalibacter halelectricus]|uniref:Class I SAM-dependent rRNA methyltransferase n=1 Tax=Geoalkalibacter halelectricus TaxID=2847045 RepID=A0ABY5ZSW3_9BACT|nr:class I SAM-dependent rRNA methyltransferase [Geoalkalibacter halelectricus]MDO3379237.1 class I SAM-dependent rRNA methyltransferase [Geoalkalibacter halelectricus]UWZ80995.1 class I SAM-dependent rRNA methyltransferase [Geoalkalibacter halelectricus]
MKIILAAGRERRLLSGHPWVFSNEIQRVEGAPEPGDSVAVHSARGAFLGCGHYNPRSLISVRLLSSKPQDIDLPEFFQARIAQALAYRRATYGELDGVRLVYGESDFLPGLVVDRYGPVLSLQFLSLGMDRRRDLIVAALQKLLEPRAVVARNDVGVRELEGLPQQVEVLAGEVPEQVMVSENGLRFAVDILGGQKTGHFLDQKENHQALRDRVGDGRVLDLFCYSGAWAVHAAHYGAREVLGVDISAAALALARGNAERNGLAERCRFTQGDVFEVLRDLAAQGERFDTIVLDPPAFVKSKKRLAEAVRGYLTINRRAMELLAPGGFLFTCSCSYHMERELFLDTLRQAAAKANRTLRLVEVRGQALDHPVLLACPETDYLKCVILQAL